MRHTILAAALATALGLGSLPAAAQSAQDQEIVQVFEAALPRIARLGKGDGAGHVPRERDTALTIVERHFARRSRNT